MPDERDITAGYHRGDELSEAAFASVRHDRPRQRQLVFDAVWRAMPDGLTGDEIEVLLGASHQAVSARLAELRRDAWLAEHARQGVAAGQDGRRRRLVTAETRLTRSGRPARVHFIPAHIWRPAMPPPNPQGTAPPPPPVPGPVRYAQGQLFPDSDGHGI